MGAIIPVAVLALWEFLSRIGVLSEDGFSRPSRFFVAGAKALADGTLLTQTAQTFAAAGQALAMAAIAGIVLGAILGLFRPLERAASLTIESLRPIPSVALIPLSL
ncbi:MAG TPA: ABC transporter permease, partial [Burkholderiales bacterium]|nr:ABC transporter permease [Burkholderiales bacterium]